MFTVFRLYVSSSVDRTVYVLDEIGMQTDMFEVSSPVRGIAVDYFSSPHSFIYSVDRETTGQGAYVLRTYVGDTVGNQLFALPGRNDDILHMSAVSSKFVYFLYI